MPTPTAAILVIGNEILSGKTQDANIAFIAKHLGKRGIPVHEVRVVRDDEAAMIDAINTLRQKYTYLFTTGGIGPTHDDITSPTVAKAFGVKWVVDPEAKRRLEKYYTSTGSTLNEARLRMATLPEGATLIDNPVSVAPAFKIGNVFVLAGVPRIMQAMLLAADAAGLIEGGPPVLSITLKCNQREGDIAKELGSIQADFLGVEIGSYPHMFQTPSLSLVLHGTDAGSLILAADQIEKLIAGRGEKAERIEDLGTPTQPAKNAAKGPGL
jgi:molybdenum cofactor synthesis domain-containing protein